MIGMNPPQRSLTPVSPLPKAWAKTVGLHPLLYRKRINDVDRTARPGDLLAVHDAEDQLAGFGLFNPKSEIPVRMLCRGATPPDEAFWRAKLASAVELRRDVLKLDEVANAYRLVHAEGDGLSGLVVDRYGDILSAEAFGLGMWQRGRAILELLAPLVGANHWTLRPGPATVAQEGFEAEPISSPDLPSRVTIFEHGTRFRVDFTAGHKTGFFCDQRDNRKLVASFCKDKTVLDLCCYTGGFSVQAKKLGGAAEVTGVDLDEEPLALARENANLNQVRCRFVQADVFAYMRDMLSAGRKFDVVILDPPKLIRNRRELEDGTRKHFDLNRLAMQLVAPGGLLVSCTCAGLLTHEAFLSLIYSAARQAGDELRNTGTPPRRGPRDVQVLFQTGAAPDHPVLTNCPEGEYLQAVWMRML